MPDERVGDPGSQGQRLRSLPDGQPGEPVPAGDDGHAAGATGQERAYMVRAAGVI